MQGKIIKGISGFYYVYVAGTGIYECKAKGIFRQQKVKPLVGDNVRITVLDEEKMLGNVEEILPRCMEMIRPAVANVDMALVIFAAAEPEPNLNLMDRFLCMMEYLEVPVHICFNKCDLAEEEKLNTLRTVYEKAGYPVTFTCAKKRINVEEILSVIEGKTATVAGPSGVGKSSLINALQENFHMETGEISEKIKRGKNTTRHTQIIPVSDNTYIMDTPGFSSLDVPEVEKEDLWKLYAEFRPYEPECRFAGCSHVNEPDCGVKNAVEAGKIAKERYENYKILYEEKKNLRKSYK